MIRERIPDKKRAFSMIQAAEKDMKFILSLSVSLESGQTIVRGIYENFRMLGDAFLWSQGKEAFGDQHHEEMIGVLYDFPIKTERSIRTLSTLKTLRHTINYKGYVPSLLEIEDARSLAHVLFPKLLEYMRKRFQA